MKTVDRLTAAVVCMLLVGCAATDPGRKPTRTNPAAAPRGTEANARELMEAVRSLCFKELVMVDRTGTIRGPSADDRKRHLGVVKTTLEAGADPNRLVFSEFTPAQEIRRTSSGMRESLMIAGSLGTIEAAATSVKHAQTALDVAREAGDGELAALLKKYGAR